MTNSYVQPNRQNNEMKSFSLPVISLCVYIVVATAFEDGTAVNTAYASYALYGCLAVCGVSCVLSRRFQWYKIITCLLILGIVLSISYLYSPTNAEYMNGRLYRYWTSFILILLVSNVIKSENDIRALINSFIIAGCCLALLIYSFYGITYLVSAGQRLQNGDFGNVNYIGGCCALSIALATYKLVIERKHKVLFSVAIIICLPIVMFSGSRKALLTLLVAIVAFVISYSENDRITKRLFWIAVVVLVFWLSVNYISAFEPIRERLFGLLNVFTGKGDLVAGDAHRMQYIEEGWKAFLNKPIFGNGFCYSTYLFNAYSHNNYIELLMNNGLVGFFSFYSVYIILISKLKRIKNNRKIYSLAVMMIVLNLFMDIGVVDYYSRLTLISIVLIYKPEMIFDIEESQAEGLFDKDGEVG